MDGRMTGSVTVHMRRSLLMPRFSDASSSELSMLFIAPEVYRYMYGNRCSVNTKMMPPRPYIVGATRPIFAKSFASRPARPSRIIHEYAPMNGGLIRLIMMKMCSTFLPGML